MDDHSARLHLARTLRDVASIGFTLPVPVEIELASHLTSSRVDNPIGQTSYRYDSSGRLVELRIRVLTGMLPLVFGKTVAHEVGHAWIAQQRRPLQDRVLAEGFAEYVEYLWTLRQDDPQVPRVLDSQQRNTDPVYGTGFRLVRRAVEVHGHQQVVASLVEHGSLPPEKASRGAGRQPQWERLRGSMLDRRDRP